MRARALVIKLKPIVRISMLTNVWSGRNYQPQLAHMQMFTAHCVGSVCVCVCQRVCNFEVGSKHPTVGLVSNMHIHITT